MCHFCIENSSSTVYACIIYSWRSLYKLKDAIIYQPKWLNFVRNKNVLQSSEYLWNFSMDMRFTCYGYFGCFDGLKWGAYIYILVFYEQWNVMFVWPSGLMEFQQTMPKTVLSFILYAINISLPLFFLFYCSIWQTRYKKCACVCVCAVP